MRVGFGDCEDRYGIETGRGWYGRKGDGVEREWGLQEGVRSWLGMGGW